MTEDELDYERDEEEGTSGDDDSSAAATITFAEDEFADLYTANPDLEDEAAPTRCEFVCGIAGSGKTFEILRRCQENPDYAVLSASTGISAVNLSATTIHSLLGFSNLNSLRDSRLSHSAHRKLRALAQDGYRNVVIDEISMISHQMLDLLVDIFDEVNQDLKNSQHPIGLVLVGDFAQLPPIGEGKGKNVEVPWAFEAACWNRFEPNTTRLTRSYRQESGLFLDALNFARAGEGDKCVDALEAGGLEFQTFTDMEFEGTTILSKNDAVDTYNLEAMKRVKGKDMYLPARRWGHESGDWKKIPPQTKVRDNAYVMLLANSPGATRGTFEYVNGDCGHIRGITQQTTGMPYINVELVRTGKIVKVPSIVRSVEHREKPDGLTAAEKVEDAYYPKPHFSKPKKRYISGQLQYYPLRLAYATTCHKSQGLSLDKVQVDVRDWMFKNPAMSYIAMSRCRSLAGLRLVGMKEVVARNCRMDPKVQRWL